MIDEGARMRPRGLSSVIPIRTISFSSIRAVFPLAIAINLLWIVPPRNLEQGFGGSAIVGGSVTISGLSATLAGVEPKALER